MKTIEYKYIRSLTTLKIYFKEDYILIKRKSVPRKDSEFRQIEKNIYAEYIIGFDAFFSFLANDCKFESYFCEAMGESENNVYTRSLETEDKIIKLVIMESHDIPEAMRKYTDKYIKIINKLKGKIICHHKQEMANVLIDENYTNIK